MKPYRLVVFATGTRIVGRGKKREERRVGYAYMGWTPTQIFDAGARLPGAGSFLYGGMHAVRRAAIEYLALPETHQVSIRTNQDRSVYRFIKHVDGRVTGYGEGEVTRG